MITYSIENSISIDGLPEDIIYDGNFLWVTVPHSDLSFSSGSKIMKIDIHSNRVGDELDVGDGVELPALQVGVSHDLLVHVATPDAV